MKSFFKLFAYAPVIILIVMGVSSMPFHAAEDNTRKIKEELTSIEKSLAEITPQIANRATIFDRQLATIEQDNLSQSSAEDKMFRAIQFGIILAEQTADRNKLEFLEDRKLCLNNQIFSERFGKKISRGCPASGFERILYRN